MISRIALPTALLACLLLVPAAGATPAASPAKELAPAPQKTIEVELLLFQFENEEGTVSNFQVVNGGSVDISDRERGLFYSLFAHKDEKGQAQIRLVQYENAARTQELGSENLGIDLDSGLQTSVIAPFKIAWVGERMQLGKVVSQPSKYIECCVSCGGWTICCGVAIFNRLAGICCTIDHCGWLCTVCEFTETAS
jgi:glucose/arabinose dehydrogenase